MKKPKDPVSIDANRCPKFWASIRPGEQCQLPKGHTGQHVFKTKNYMVTWGDSDMQKWVDDK